MVSGACGTPSRCILPKMMLVDEVADGDVDRGRRWRPAAIGATVRVSAPASCDFGGANSGACASAKRSERMDSSRGFVTDAWPARVPAQNTPERRRAATFKAASPIGKSMSRKRVAVNGGGSPRGGSRADSPGPIAQYSSCSAKPAILQPKSLAMSSTRIAAATPVLRNLARLQSSRTRSCGRTSLRMTELYLKKHL